MMVYVLFGGMTATTWVQIIKACLLLAGASFMGFMVLCHYGFSPEAMFADAVKVKTDIATAAGKTPEEAASPARRSWGRAPSSRTRSRRSRFGMALMFGTAGLPHILMRFFTVPERQGSAQVGDVGDHLDRLLLPPDLHHRLRRHHLRADQPGLPRRRTASSSAATTWRRCISPTRSAATSSSASSRRWPSRPSSRSSPGLTLSGASAVSHDLYSTVIKKGKADSAAELRVSRITTICLGIVAVILGIAFQKQNIAFMVSLAFAVAASANFPVLFMSVLWKDCTTKGAVVGGFLGLISSVLLTVLSPSVWEATLGNPVGSAPFPYTSPAIFSMTLAFLAIWIVSKMDNSARAKIDRAGFLAQQVRSETGIGASEASAH